MKLPPSAKNWLTIIGASIAGVNLILIIILFIISTIFHEANTNLGLFIYIILPGFLVLGLVVIPVGMIHKRRMIRKEGETGEGRFPRIDLNDTRHRNAFIIFTVTSIVVLMLSTMGSFKAYHITESVEFCGKLCHQVMEPEDIAYQNSPHANVLCVECHVGAGASWYVKSKLSGLHQVYAVLVNNYPRPIETPLHDLRPARETCERCHWPQKFYSRSLVTNKYFISDSANTEWDISLDMKVGPEYTGMGLKEGIHWHINPDVQIDYISENDKREVITYVKYINKNTGAVTIFRDENNPVSDSIVDASSARTMDCIDCHNRPSHNYKSPSFYVNQAMLTGSISRDIPYIKQVSMGILANKFRTTDTAMIAIETGLTDYYKENYPDYYNNNKDIINSSIEAIKNGFNMNTFPAMKVSADVYPEHIGHLETNGCFRCHNGTFKSDDGQVISRDCNLCHTIVGQGSPDNMQYTDIKDTLQFKHPVDIDNAWQDSNCSDCHSALY